CSFGTGGQSSFEHKQNKRFSGSTRLNKNSKCSTLRARRRDIGARNGANPLNVPICSTRHPARAHITRGFRFVKCVTCWASSSVATKPNLSNSHSIIGQAL